MWIESHSEVWNHFKTKRLQRHLGISITKTVGHLVSLWHFTLDNACMTGNLEQWGDDGIEDGCRWDGKPGVLIAALREVGFLDSYIVHDWLDYAGDLIKKRRAREIKKINDNAVLIEDAGLEFEKFWQLYPHQRRARRVEAARAWIELSPDKKLVSDIMLALENHKNSIDWQRESGAFIPFPNNWLSNRRWEDRMRSAPPIPPTPKPKCDACGYRPREAQSIYCKECGWCAGCDEETQVQKYGPNELVKGRDGRPSCPEHSGGTEIIR